MKMMNMLQRNVKWMRSVNLLYKYFFSTLTAMTKATQLLRQTSVPINILLCVVQAEYIYPVLRRVLKYPSLLWGGEGTCRPYFLRSVNIESILTNHRPASRFVLQQGKLP